MNRTLKYHPERYSSSTPFESQFYSLASPPSQSIPIPSTASAPPQLYLVSIPINSTIQPCVSTELEPKSRQTPAR